MTHHIPSLRCVDMTLDLLQFSEKNTLQACVTVDYAYHRSLPLIHIITTQNLASSSQFAVHFQLCSK